jgi:hypothetical protein
MIGGSHHVPSGLVEVLVNQISLQIESQLSEIEQASLASKQRASMRRGPSEAEVIRNGHHFIDNIHAGITLLLQFSTFVLQSLSVIMTYLTINEQAAVQRHLQHDRLFLDTTSHDLSAAGTFCDRARTGTGFRLATFPIRSLATTGFCPAFGASARSA